MTNLDYLNDSYLFESNTIIIGFEKDEKGTFIVLESTIFYPQGGGQPTDTGEIYTNNAIFKVTNVRINQSGTVLHYGYFINGTIENGEKVTLKINKEKRLSNIKLHSAGHLLDCVVIEMNLENLQPTKGFHFPEGPYVEYDGVLNSPTEIIPKIEGIMNDLITQNIQVNKQYLSIDEASKLGIWSPEGKSARIITYMGYPSCGCGGTHVNSTSEIGKITIRKIKSKKGKTRISYSVN